MIDPKRFSLHIGVFSLVFVAFFLFILTKSIYSWAIIPVFAGLAILLGKPQAMLWWGLGWFMVTQYVQNEMRVGFFNYLDEFVTLGMLAVLFVHSRKISSFMPERIRSIQPMVKLMTAFVLLVIVSAIINRAIDIYLVMWSFQYLRVFVVFFFAVRFLRTVDYRIFINFVLLFGLAHFLLNLGWKLHINPFPNEKEYWASDFGVGTFNGCDQVAYFCVMIIMLCLSIVIDPPTKKLGKRASIIMVLTFLNFMLTNTNHAYFVLAGAMGTFFLVNYRSVTKVVSLPALMGVFGAGIGIFILFSVYTDAGRSLKPEYLKLRYEQFMKGTKMLSYRRNISELPFESSFFWLAGHGPGQGGSSIGRALRRPIGDKYFNVIYQERKYIVDVAGGSISSGEQTGLLTYWSELGPIGLGLLLLVNLTMFSKTSRRLHIGDYINPYQRAIARAFPSVVVTMLMLSFLRDLYYIAWTVGLFGVWAALAFTAYDKNPNSKFEDASLVKN